MDARAGSEPERSLQAVWLEPEDNSALHAEIVLGAATDYGAIAEASVNPINLR